MGRRRRGDAETSPNIAGTAKCNWRVVSFNDVANETIQEGNYEK